MRVTIFMNQNIRTAAGRRKNCIVVKADHHKRGIHGSEVRFTSARCYVQQSEKPNQKIHSHTVHAWVVVLTDEVELRRGGRWIKVRGPKR